MKENNDQSDHIVDVYRLIEAVRGSRAAQILFELRPWLLHSGDCKGDEDPPDQQSES